MHVRRICVKYLYLPPVKKTRFQASIYLVEKIMDHKSFIISAIKNLGEFAENLYLDSVLSFLRERWLWIHKLYTPHYLLEEHRESIPGICFRCCNPPVWRERAGRWASRQVGSRRWLRSPSWSSLSNPQPLEAAPSCPPPPGWQGRGIQPPSQLAWCRPPPPSVRWSCTPHRSRAGKKMPGFIDLGTTSKKKKLF